MKKETLLTVAVIALLLLNLGMLGFLFFQRPPRPGAPDPLGRRIVETLQLDDAQQQQFEVLKTAHHAKMEDFNKAYRDGLGNYFALLKNERVDTAQRDSLQAMLVQIQNERLNITFQHFAELKALCTPEQQQRFQDLLPELMQVILPRPERRGPPGRGGR